MDKANLHVYTNYTTHPLVQILNNELIKNKLKYEIIQGEFDSAFSQILNSSENSTYSSNDIIFVQYIPKLSSNLINNLEEMTKYKVKGIPHTIVCNDGMPGPGMPGILTKQQLLELINYV